MKKVLVTTIFAVIMISSSLFYVSCSKETINLNQSFKSNNLNKQQSPETLIKLADFDSRTQQYSLIHSVGDWQNALTTAFIDEYGYGAVTLDDVSIIDDDFYDNQQYANIMFQGQIVSEVYNEELGNFESVSFAYKFGFELIKGEDGYYLEDITVLIGGYTSWKCDGVNCASCMPDRNRWGRVNGCKDCTSVGDPEQPAYCNHSSSGGGGTLVGHIISILF